MYVHTIHVCTYNTYIPRAEGLSFYHPGPGGFSRAIFRGRPPTAMPPSRHLRPPDHVSHWGPIGRAGRDNVVRGLFLCATHARCAGCQAPTVHR